MAQLNFYNNCTVQDDLPEGVEIRKIENFGHGLFSTRSFAKGEIVYHGKQYVIPNEYVDFTLEAGCNSYKMDTTTHSVQVTESERLLFLFDAFTNHSCDPTTLCLYPTYGNTYECIALRDIHEGDPINADYNIFEYDCEGKQFDNCMCGASTCLRGVYGFRYLTREQQKERVHQANVEVLRRMDLNHQDKFKYIEELGIPEGVTVQEPQDDQGYRLVALKDFKEGQVIGSFKSTQVGQGCDLIVEIAKYKRVWIDSKPEEVTEFHGFAHFTQQSSSDPNTIVKKNDENVCELIALKDIKQGEELTKQ